MKIPAHEHEDTIIKLNTMDCFKDIDFDFNLDEFYNENYEHHHSIIYLECFELIDIEEYVFIELTKAGLHPYYEKLDVKIK